MEVYHIQSGTPLLCSPCTTFWPATILFKETEGRRERNTFLFFATGAQSSASHFLTEALRVQYWFWQIGDECTFFQPWKALTLTFLIAQCWLYWKHIALKRNEILSLWIDLLTFMNPMWLERMWWRGISAVHWISQIQITFSDLRVNWRSFGRQKVIWAINWKQPLIYSKG